jgi:hypothetical protein
MRAYGEAVSREAATILTAVIVMAVVGAVWWTLFLSGWAHG